MIKCTLHYDITRDIITKVFHNEKLLDSYDTDFDAPNAHSDICLLCNTKVEGWESEIKEQCDNKKEAKSVEGLKYT
jgi:hypothetical protein